MDTNFCPAHAILGFAYEQDGQFDKALQQFEQGQELSNESPIMVAEIGRLKAIQGDDGSARRALQKLEKLRKERYVPADNIAIIYAELDDMEKAFELFQEALDEQATGLIQLKVEPKLNKLRSDARFAYLMRRVGLD